MKECFDCKVCKPLELFRKNKTNPDGLDYYCKPCKGKRDSISHQKNKEKRKIARQQFVSNNREKVSAQKKAERTKNAERYREYHKNRYQEKKQEIKVKNNARAKVTKKERNKRDKERKERDPLFKIRGNLRSRLSQAIRTDQKKGSAIKDLGCSMDFFKSYLESLFSPGMSWDNYGRGPDKWNIDHKIPLTAFDLTNRDQLLRACHYTNLQPMWHLLNISKGNKV